MFLRDDGFGPEVARRLAGDPLGAVPGVRVEDYGIRGLHLAYDLLAGVDLLVIVDTVPPEHPADQGAGPGTGPGSIRVLRVGSEDLDGRAALDPHGMDPVAVLGRLRSLGGELPLTYVVGCVPADLAEGIGLSAPAAAAIPQAVKVIGALLAQHTSVEV
jgi:hydrogenase maturation protease